MTFWKHTSKFFIQVYLCNRSRCIELNLIFEIKIFVLLILPNILIVFQIPWHVQYKNRKNNNCYCYWRSCCLCCDNYGEEFFVSLHDFLKRIMLLIALVAHNKFPYINFKIVGHFRPNELDLFFHHFVNNSIRSWLYLVFNRIIISTYAT